MKYSEIINEMPISDIHLDGPLGDFSAGKSFSKVDHDLLQSKKGRAKMIKAFSKTPFDFEIFFINNEVADGESIIDNYSLGNGIYSAGIRKHYNQDVVNKKFDSKNARKSKPPLRTIANPVIKAETGKIRVVVPANLSELTGKTPMTAWTLAHKIGHSFQDHLYDGSIKNRAKAWTTVFGKTIEQIGFILEKISALEFVDDDEEENKLRADHAKDFVRSFDSPRGLVNLMTMKSARDADMWGSSSKKHIQDTFEIFPELIAQWLISGKITLKTENPESSMLVDEINKLIAKAFARVVGKVLVVV